MTMFPNYDVSGRRVTPQEIVDVIPEQEKQDAQIQRSEEAYLRQLEKNEFDKAQNTKDMFGGLEKLSLSIQDLVTKRQEKYKQDREAQIKLDILTRGVSPELEASFRGQRATLFEDDLAAQEFASKIEADTGDSITANEFRKMSGWERYMVAEQYA